MVIHADLIASGLAAPTFATSAPGVPDKLFITEKDSGRVVVLDLGTNQVSAQAFFDVPAAEMSSAGEGGLLIYNPTNGNLYYDVDGVGGAASQLVATLANLPSLSADDISVI